MGRTMQERQHVGRKVALRYLRARKKEKGIMLQEFCVTTGSSSPYAAYLLRTSAKRVILGGVTLAPLAQTAEARVWSCCSGGTRRVYHLARELCGERLQTALPELLHALERSGTE